jgi:lysyl-tRNA synthetase class 1
MPATLSSWPFAEARALLERVGAAGVPVATFETGFGPSGLPHIGTFAEVARTTWIRHALEHASGMKSRLIAFSDDMDGLRKVPLNMPNQEMLLRHLGEPLFTIPDPFGEAESYSGYMNRKLKEFLDAYGFEYQFQSSQQAYSLGHFDEGLTLLLRKVDEVRNVIIPTLSEENRETWSPFFPICASCGRVYSTRVTAYHAEDLTLEYLCDQETGSGTAGARPGCGHRAVTSVLGGKVKVGWKVDWALRWYSYGVDYEMYGKDLIESAKLSAKLVRLLGKKPPIGLVYELFLDEEGKKISKSVGKGLSVDSWVSYAPLESLLFYLLQNPKRAKRLYWDVVPKSVDDYLAELTAYPGLPEEKRPDSAIWHLSNAGRDVASYASTVNFSLISNLISGIGSDEPSLIRDFLVRYDPRATEHRAVVEDLIVRASRYYRDFILPTKKFRPATDAEKTMFAALRKLVLATPGEEEDLLQSLPFTVAKEAGVEPQALFRALYEVLMGQERGPRFGTLVRLVGKERMIALLDKAVAAP